MTKQSLEALRDLATAALVGAGTAEDTARAVARAVVAAEADGLASHGLSRIPFYAAQVRSGKVDGQARPEVSTPARSAVVADAQDGFAFPAIRKALDRGIQLMRDAGTVGIAVRNSHHAGAGGYHVEHVASYGYVALGFTNSPSAMAPWGGRRGSLGTNPIAFACPRRDHPPLVIDLSLSQVARGRIMIAQKEARPIPEGWALDADGQPTTDPDRALGGTMLPIGGAKGAALALMVEILTAALSGSHFAFEASSFFTADGPPPRIGQSFLLIDPAVFAGEEFAARLEILLGDVLGQDGTRLPGDRRLARRARARSEGLELPGGLHAELAALAGGGPTR